MWIHIIVLTLLFESFDKGFGIFPRGQHFIVCPYAKENCVNLTLKKLPHSARERIVTVHNQFRNMVALGESLGLNSTRLPEASNMNELKWHWKLQETVERWAIQCFLYPNITQNDSCRLEDLGKNVKKMSIFDSSSSMNYETIIQSWANHIAYFSFEQFQILQKNTEQWNQLSEFLQLIYAPVDSIGCAEIVLTNTSDTAIYFICVYKPKIPTTTTQMYIPGPPCTKCPIECSRKRFKALCRNFGGMEKKFDSRRRRQETEARKVQRRKDKADLLENLLTEQMCQYAVEHSRTSQQTLANGDLCVCD